MSQPILKSALAKRKTDGHSRNNVLKKAHIAPDVKDPKPSLRRQNTCGVRDGDSFFDSDPMDPKVFIPQYEQDLATANHSLHESGPNNLPLDSSSNRQEDAIFNKSSPTKNDHVALFPQDQVTDLSTSSDFQPNINWPLTYSSPMSVMSPLNIPHVRNFYSGPCTVIIRQSKGRATNGINDDHQPDKTGNVDGDDDKIGNSDGDEGNTDNSDGDDDKTGNADADQQDKTSISVPNSHKTFKIFDATDTIPPKYMDLPNVETVAGLKDLIIQFFLKEKQFDSSRIRLTFILGLRPIGSTEPQGRKSFGLPLIDDNKTLAQICGGESEGHLKVHIAVQILPSFVKI